MNEWMNECILKICFCIKSAIEFCNDIQEREKKKSKKIKINTNYEEERNLICERMNEFKETV